ncbi:MAG: primosomal protein N' [Lachnospiraceae bacterium]|nr:primosomal protein N' [Lachnospiraceae bacterium]
MEQAVKYADIIIDISTKNVDRVFQYRIPSELIESVQVGSRVMVPFGKGDTMRKGYVVSITTVPSFAPERIKEIQDVVPGAVSVQEQMILLAWWMKERYGSTMNQALKTVIPVKSKVAPKEEKTIVSLKTSEELQELLGEAERKNFKARIRLYKALLENGELPYRLTAEKLGITNAMLKPLQEKGILTVKTETKSRDPIKDYERESRRVILNEEQQVAAETVITDYDAGKRGTYLLYGITGSGKTEVYMELIEHVLKQGKQAIVLIPEISLTYQTVMRFYRRFGNRVSIINSRLSAGERYDQLERAARGEIDIMIGPRSALFTPFANLGLIIIDEEHEGAYKSETSPRYHAREVARMRANMNHASLVLGSATPSMESYYKALHGEYKLLLLHNRAKKDSRLANVHVIDLREELAEGNRSVFSRKLRELMEERLQKGEQIMLFMNRRGYANFVSCRSCGEAMQCPHCDVSLTYHRDGTLKCHYCGHEILIPKICPDCGSPFIAPFGAGTQKLEEMTKKTFPNARVLRMDADTTAKKGAHEEILQAFSEGDADILIGTQMIVKGHDFPKVTLVGIMAADLSLYAPDFRSGERTFELLTQASGRAGRSELPGDVVIQTYAQDHFAITSAAEQDYEQFYKEELLYRKMMGYPPAVGILGITLSSKDERALVDAMGYFHKQILKEYCFENLVFIGPVDASPYKLNDIYRKILYIKNESYDILLKVRKSAQILEDGQECFKNINFQYDL